MFEAIVSEYSHCVCRAGCGLPPGPGGLLGAAEGVSYLTVSALAIWSAATKLSTGHSLPKGEPTSLPVTA